MAMGRGINIGPKRLTEMADQYRPANKTKPEYRYYLTDAEYVRRIPPIWTTVRWIARELGYLEASVSARLNELRKKGIVEKQRVAFSMPGYGWRFRTEWRIKA